MPPKKQKPKRDIMSYFHKETVNPGGSSTMSTQPEEASTSQMAAARKVKVEKEEDDTESKGRHSLQRRQFTVKFSTGGAPYTIDCDQACTVLDAIKSHQTKQFEKMKKKMRDYSDSKIIIQRSNNSIIATHFPCSCINDNECLTIVCKGKEVEKNESQPDEIFPRDKYSVFLISKTGGENTSETTLLRSSPGRNIVYVCVYAKKGTSVKEALKRDGRFNDLEDFKLFEVETPIQYTECTEMVDNLDQKKFTICQDRQTANLNEQTSSEQQEQSSKPKQSQQRFDTKSVLDAAQESGISVKMAMKNTGSKVRPTEIYKLLCEQFPRLKTWMENRFPRDSYQEALELKKEDFGKIQQSFNEVHRVRELLKLGESVCLLKINIFLVTVQGTGFLLFDKFILTNAHLFEKCTDLRSDQWRERVKITATFNYENPDSDSNKKEFTAKLYSGCNIGLDYVILKLNQTEKTELPEGLLSKFAPPPDKGGACLIGHPAGEVKQIDPTCIIEKKDREQAVNQNLEEYRDHIFTLCAINQEIRKDPYADVHVTYNSFMYHGSSGSPVFDAHGRVFGLHSGGFFFGFVKPNESVIEFAYPLLTIFENFVKELKKPGQEEMFVKVEKAAKGNPYLEQIIEGLNAEEPMESD